MDNKAFCVLPWLHLHVMPDSSVIPCCVSPYHDHYGNVSSEEMKAIWNNEKFRNLRKDMIAERLPPGCSRCHSLESLGFSSMRTNLNMRFQHLIPDFIKKTEADGTYSEIKLRYIDIRFSNLCNFKCRGCGPDLSSSWYEDHANLFGYKPDKPKVKSISVDSPRFWTEFETMVGDAEEIYFGGGEPLITKEHFDLLRLLIHKGHTNVRLSYNTNLSTLTYGNHDLTSLWANFKDVTLGISLDDIGSRAEYFRHGTKWNHIVSNMRKLRDEFQQIGRYVNVTVSAFNVLYLPELFKFLVAEEIINHNSFNINMLLDPMDIRADVYPLHVKEKIKLKLQTYAKELLKDGHLKASRDFVNIIKLMMSNDNSHLFEQFKVHTKKLDSIRGESFSRTYPELHQFIGDL